MGRKPGWGLWQLEEGGGRKGPDHQGEGNPVSSDNFPGVFTLGLVSAFFSYNSEEVGMHARNLTEAEVTGFGK